MVQKTAPKVQELVRLRLSQSSQQLVGGVSDADRLQRMVIIRMKPHHNGSIMQGWN